MNSKMLMPLLGGLMALFSSVAFADSANLGATLPLKTNQDGTPVFGAAYTYDDDPDGSNYLVTLSACSNSPRTYRWNFYLASLGSYMLEWSPNRATSLTAAQLRVADADVVFKILAGQKKVNDKAELYVVFADDNNTPIYNVSVSDLCASNPKAFRNLTDDKSCDQF